MTSNIYYISNFQTIPISAKEKKIGSSVNRKVKRKKENVENLFVGCHGGRARSARKILMKLILCFINSLRSSTSRMFCSFNNCIGMYQFSCMYVHVYLETIAQWGSEKGSKTAFFSPSQLQTNLIGSFLRNDLRNNFARELTYGLLNPNRHLVLFLQYCVLSQVLS